MADPRELTEHGRRRLAWASSHMPILGQIRDELARNRPFENLTIGICLHVEAKTGVWVRALVAGGAKVSLTGSPGSTQDDVAATLGDEDGIEVFGRRADTREEHLQNARRVLEARPDLIVDNGADLHALLAESLSARDGTDAPWAATEETTSGADRLRTDIRALPFPTVIINDCRAKRIIENRYGVGQSVVDALMRSTNLMLGGRQITVIGYGPCGQGISLRLRGLGARVTVVEQDPVSRLEAHLEGFETVELADALRTADIVVTVTGRPGILRADEFALLRDGVLLANAGHFEFEIDVAGLDELAVSRERARPEIEMFELADGRIVSLLGRGSLVNLSAGDGNPIEVMDLGLGLQALSLAHLVERAASMEPGPQGVPPEVEERVARIAHARWTR